ncbi:Pkinase-domain-containing protein [Pleurotus eryngii]|uniref:non-specific serine/threonine protein kinase n=1 Tax=Pleurotus eryngii TaxID=5323 RepID=A0A9P6ACF6_PLEER|nr:Pkinase-domain-containing protein [Pleurotus eryngii]
MATTASLQIPSAEPGPSRQQPIQQGQYRPVSVAVQPASATSPPPSAARRQRASHTVQPSSRDESTSGSHSGSAPVAYHDVYSHPAAVAYLAAHPRRTIPKFGPYLLLHTLGEGEFGKVKLGLHSLWGEEVAVKLIRRGNVDNNVRMSKVEREIEVLRTLKHPNIVRLYDVIETDKYIGIILEYASGGELFDHILAHRYLREGYASKLFYQLLSGVWYIHQKKIVHRDLKLENLLLDRHRNILITDFGFANRFEHRADDLMQTSCGSPCYAAPELVISEGLYVGSAVDIWSCGVILYAMLAGYLPFDDDPANPDGDNINLLYKYIVNTPLTFPDYISDQARDLLSLMLVPDPTKRASLEAVMNHSWLAAFHAPPAEGEVMDIDAPRAFGRTVEDLERQAMEQHQQKRLAYQRQMRAAAAAATGQHQQSSTTSPHGHGSRHGHHSYQPDVLSAGPASAGVVSPNNRHRERSEHHRERTQPEYLYETSLDQSYASTASPGMPTPPTSAPAVSGSTAASAGRKGFVPSPVAVPMDEDDPFSMPVGPKSAGVVANNAPAERERRPSMDGTQLPAAVASPPLPEVATKSPPKKPADGFRHTIQVEYDEPKSSRRSDDRATSRRSEDKEKERRKERTDRDRSASPRRSAGAGNAGRSPSVGSKRDERDRQNRAASGSKPLPPSPNILAAEPPITTSTAKRNGETPVPAVGERTPTKAKSSAANGVSTPTHPRNNGPNTLSMPTPVVNVKAASPPGTPIAFSPTAKDRDDTSMDIDDAKGARKKPSSEDKPETSSQHSRGSGHRRGLSAVGLGKIFGGSPSSTNERIPSEGSDTSGQSGSRRPSTLQLPSDGESKKSSVGSSVLLSPAYSDKEGKEKDPKKTSRRNTLTVMVEPFSRSIRNRNNKGRGASTPLHTPGAETANIETKDVPMPSMPAKEELNADEFIKVSQADTSVDLDAGGMQASTSAAKKVMQWFRGRGRGGRDSIGLGDPPLNAPELPEKEPAERSRTPTQLTTNEKANASSTTVNQANAVTSPKESARSPSTQRGSLSPLGHPQRSASSGVSNPLSIGRWIRPSLTTASPAVTAARTRQTTKNPNDAIRIHHGPVVTATITNMAPPEVMKHVKQVLEGMGVEIQLESEFKYRCVRVKRRKGAVSGPVAGGDSSSQLTAVNMMGSAASNGVDRRGLPVPSHGTFSGNMLKGLLMRRQSSQVSSPNMQPSLSFDDEAISPIGETSSQSINPLQDHSPVYGDISQDAGDEVRFSVELTRLDGLNDTYSLDIRRLRGNLRSYKFLHDIIRDRADLQR